VVELIRHPHIKAMDAAEFKRSISHTVPPKGLSPALTALWWAGKNSWDKAHRIVMSEEDTDCAWVHAYLHRLEGDLDNARYWYRQAKRKPPRGDHASEWDAIVSALLS
jgi:hypothetical protein